MFESDLGVRASSVLNDSDVPGKSLKDGLTNLKSQVESVIPGFTEGSIPFSGENGKLTQDNERLFWDNVQKYVGIGTNSPDEPLHISSAFDGNRAVRMQNESEGDAAVARFIVDVFGGSAYLTAYGSNFTTVGAKRANSGAVNASNSLAAGLSIVAKNVAAAIRFYAGGNEDSHMRMKIAPDGKVGIGTETPSSKLDVVGLSVYASNAAAIAGGLTAGAFYRTGADPDPVCVVH